ncbi:UDP-3-O-[3-hydroxymyristoyl] N-acetylglucosamine deacetylase [Campylobacter sputorum subsp. bubulus]|uniref:UDP-3-O-acyl-N-acetylglucosamine deacetylase n=1 Tax=Campylobacter sputorum subsp. sputorum TaxID=32024 RepID=A0A381DKD1_9BACT|nr:UDP-3-O-acyl-N-acetylglucosamine deacetylase [Campylobacter sputorum]ASM34473.1 UDP-3-O-acyl-N-acetylglucosamine deacetylase [Campylobacter sputorum aubsp. sputorum RM3237]KAB0582139.1 UDP-3-O-acyl-N-acetylglucosamine deacetylase [Campylobacter sputorum subsp. sputorum]QEL04664.1 UDP-3-O-acyl-N-acetylglucosamine deacetylase [Campylobacter sputorum subsp. sputorum]SUX09502.1 UDP-3-O-[3-hydroxymyristoyl] N-acetylglucosamine deacetylase [Campylobacter sputorum subsp. bubulus]SUX11136.1 UDP-3-O
MNQITIEKRIEGVGIGLHKGEPIKLVLEPLESDMGVVFYRSDLGVSFKAEPKNVINTQMATVLGSKDGYVSTIEHLMSAISAYGIDNIRVVLDANEVPVMDGSAMAFCMLLDEAGIRKLDKKKKILSIKKPVEVRMGNKFVKIEPSKDFKFDYTIKFDNPVIGTQNFVFDFSKKNFIEQIAKARTFGFLKDVQMLRSKNLALGGSLDNAVVIDENRILNPEGLRFENEFVRHKILDAIGDLALLGLPMIGKYTAYAGSHELNHKLTLDILSSKENYEILTLDGEKSVEYAKAFA